MIGDVRRQDRGADVLTRVRICWVHVVPDFTYVQTKTSSSRVSKLSIKSLSTASGGAVQGGRARRGGGGAGQVRAPDGERVRAPKGGGEWGAHWPVSGQQGRESADYTSSESPTCCCSYYSRNSTHNNYLV